MQDKEQEEDWDDWGSFDQDDFNDHWGDLSEEDQNVEDEMD